MKNIAKFLGLFIMGMVLMTSCDDDENPTPNNGSEKSTVINFSEEETPFKQCGEEMEKKGIKLLMVGETETKNYVESFLQGQCSGFGLGKNEINLWPGEIQMDLTQKPTLKGIYFKGAGNGATLIVRLYDKDGKLLNNQEFDKKDFNDLYSPVEITVVYSDMEKVRYVSITSFEGYINYVHFMFKNSKR